MINDNGLTALYTKTQRPRHRRPDPFPGESTLGTIEDVPRHVLDTLWPMKFQIGCLRAQGKLIRVLTALWPIFVVMDRRRGPYHEDPIVRIVHVPKAGVEIEEITSLAHVPRSRQQLPATVRKARGVKVRWTVADIIIPLLGSFT